ncbi:unnamed protein product [Gordionus sp. m RMFG-2023]
MNEIILETNNNNNNNNNMPYFRHPDESLMTENSNVVQCTEFVVSPVLKPNCYSPTARDDEQDILPDPSFCRYKNSKTGGQGEIGNVKSLVTSFRNHDQSNRSDKLNASYPNNRVDDDADDKIRLKTNKERASNCKKRSHLFSINGILGNNNTTSSSGNDQCGRKYYQGADLRSKSQELEKESTDKPSPPLSLTDETRKRKSLDNKHHYSGSRGLCDTQEGSLNLKTSNTEKVIFPKVFTKNGLNKNNHLATNFNDKFLPYPNDVVSGGGYDSAQPEMDPQNISQLCDMYFMNYYNYYYQQNPQSLYPPHVMLPGIDQRKMAPSLNKNVSKDGVGDLLGAHLIDRETISKYGERFEINDKKLTLNHKNGKKRRQAADHPPTPLSRDKTFQGYDSNKDLAMKIIDDSPTNLLENENLSENNHFRQNISTEHIESQPEDDSNDPNSKEFISEGSEHENDLIDSRYRKGFNWDVASKYYTKSNRNNKLNCLIILRLLRRE